MVLHISRRSKYDVGTKTHLAALKEICGDEQVIMIDLAPQTPYRTNRSVAYGGESSTLDHVVGVLQGNTRHINNRIITDICNIIDVFNINIVFSEESDLGNLYLKIKENKDIKIITYFHDISADLFKQWWKDASYKNYIYRYYSFKLHSQQERIVQNISDYNIVYNESDAEKFEYYYGKKPDTIIPLTTFNNTERSIHNDCFSAENEIKKILFVCSSYYVNIKGFLWFFNEVIPYLYNKYRICIVGDGSYELQKKIYHDNILFEGYVESLEMVYREADICIMPVFDGGGMKVKTIEAISYGKCIVSTPESLNGYWELLPNQVKGKVVYCCRDEKSWIRVLNRLFFEKIPKFNKLLFDSFQENFTYANLVPRIRKVIKDVGY